MGPSKFCAKKIGHRFAIQKKWEVTELILAVKDFGNLLCYFNALHICIQSGRQMNFICTLPSQA